MSDGIKVFEGSSEAIESEFFDWWNKSFANKPRPGCSFCFWIWPTFVDNQDGEAQFPITLTVLYDCPDGMISRHKGR